MARVRGAAPLQGRDDAERRTQRSVVANDAGVGGHGAAKRLQALRIGAHAGDRRRRNVELERLYRRHPLGDVMRHAGSEYNSLEQ